MTASLADAKENRVDAALAGIRAGWHFHIKRIKALKAFLGGQHDFFCNVMSGKPVSYWSPSSVYCFFFFESAMLLCVFNNFSRKY